MDHQVDAMLNRLGAPPSTASVSKLSGGERRRIGLALALLGQPDILLLDEPTNHLDAEAVDWLQTWLDRFRGALILVTHDRYLLEAVADRIVEVEQGSCVPYQGSYGDYLLARAEREASLKKSENNRLRFLAREAAWAARSPSARTTKQKARLKRLDALSSQEDLKLDRGFDLDLRTGARHGSVLVELRGVSKAFGGRELLGELDLAIAQGDRIGVLGPNGAGKSTILNLVARQLEPDRGEIVWAPRTEIALLDQQRTSLQSPDGSDWTVFDAAGGGNSHVSVAGRSAQSWQRTGGGKSSQGIHVASFLARFMFPKEALDQRVSALSGGERTRLIMAKLLLAGAPLLLLDEPTNDLDLLTLRVLEEALLSYDGAAIIVTHDRAFLDRVCTSVLAFRPGPRVVKYASRAQVPRPDSQPVTKPQRPKREPPKKSQKLSWKEEREFEAMPAKIEALEREQEELAALLALPQTYKQPGEGLALLQSRAAALPQEIEALFERWAELETRQ